MVLYKVYLANLYQYARKALGFSVFVFCLMLSFQSKAFDYSPFERSLSGGFGDTTFHQNTLLNNRLPSFFSPPFFNYPDTLNKPRLYVWSGGSFGLYGGVMIGLSQLWYQNYERSSFHLFNDLGEWEDMDKFGHATAAYNQAKWISQGYRWAGVDQKKAAWIGAGYASLFQASFEILDGYSAKWGFSIPDIAFNTFGAALFASQDILWQEQRIYLKLAASPQSYPSTLIYSTDGKHSMPLNQRASNLYGSGLAALFIKDYNAITFWASINVASFSNKNTRFPKWLNIAVGHGAQNIYGGFDNAWQDKTTGATYELTNAHYQRYRQFYLSLDIDWERIPTKSRFLKLCFTMLNAIKVPAPALEFTTKGQLHFHPVYF